MESSLLSCDFSQAGLYRDWKTQVNSSPSTTCTSCLKVDRRDKGAERGQLAKQSRTWRVGTFVSTSDGEKRLRQRGTEARNCRPCGES